MVRVLAFLLGLLLAATVALAHPGQDTLSQWLGTLMAPNGGSCCHDKDCAPTDAKMRDGEWMVPEATPVLMRSTPAPPRWVAVPQDKVLIVPNQDGRAIVCRLLSGVIMCFVPPMGV